MKIMDFKDLFSSFETQDAPLKVNLGQSSNMATQNNVQKNIHLPTSSNPSVVSLFWRFTLAVPNFPP